MHVFCLQSGRCEAFSWDISWNLTWQVYVQFSEYLWTSTAVQLQGGGSHNFRTFLQFCGTVIYFCNISSLLTTVRDWLRRLRHVCLSWFRCIIPVSVQLYLTACSFWVKGQAAAEMKTSSHWHHVHNISLTFMKVCQKICFSTDSISSTFLLLLLLLHLLYLLLLPWWPKHRDGYYSGWDQHERL